jgi:hypothetical protein
MSDLVFREGISSGTFRLPFTVPRGVRAFYQPGGYANAKGRRTTESELDECIRAARFETIASFEVPREHWRRYHTNMTEHGRRGTGPVRRDPSFSQMVHHDECFWVTTAQKYVAYYYAIVRAKKADAGSGDVTGDGSAHVGVAGSGSG